MPTPTAKTLELKARLEQHGYTVTIRDPKVKPDHDGHFMIVDSMSDPADGGFALVGDNLDEMVAEAETHLLG